MAQTQPPNLDPLPQAPSTNTPSNFSQLMDAFLAALIVFRTQLVAFGQNVFSNALDAFNSALAAAASALAAMNSANAAAASANAAAANSNAGKWVAGNYAQGAPVWSPMDFLPYRARSALAQSAIDPKLDAANWEPQIATPFGQIEVLSINADTSMTVASKNVVRVAATVRGASLLLPAGTVINGRNGMYPIKNVGTLALPLRDASGALLAVIPAGSSALVVLEDASTAAGVWFVMCPDSKPGYVSGVATVVASACTWMGVSAIPGVPNKALIGYVYGASMWLRMATLNADGTVSLGAVTSITANMGNNEMICATDATRALAAAGDVSNTNYRVYSLTLDTVANTVAVNGTGAATGIYDAGSNTGYDPQPVALDATRVCWQATNTSPISRFLIATHGGAANPTVTVRDVTAEVGNDKANTIIGLGGGSILGVGNVGIVYYNSAGNVLSVQSTLASTSQFSIGSGSSFSACMRGFNTGSGKVVMHLGSDQAGGSPGPRDKFIGIGLSGTTVSGFTASGSFTTQLGQNKYTFAFKADSAFCVWGASVAIGGMAMRVMRASGDALTEVCVGTPEGFPHTNGNTNTQTTMRAAAVNGQKCIGLTSNNSNQPVIFGLEVIKV